MHAIYVFLGRSTSTLNLQSRVCRSLSPTAHRDNKRTHCGVVARPRCSLKCRRPRSVSCLACVIVLGSFQRGQQRLKVGPIPPPPPPPPPLPQMKPWGVSPRSGHSACCRIDQLFLMETYMEIIPIHVFLYYAHSRFGGHKDDHSFPCWT